MSFVSPTLYNTRQALGRCQSDALGVRPSTDAASNEFFKAQGETGELLCFSPCCDRGRSHSGPLRPCGPRSSVKTHPGQQHCWQSISSALKTMEIAAARDVGPGRGARSEERAHADGSAHNERQTTCPYFAVNIFINSFRNLLTR